MKIIVYSANIADYDYYYHPKNIDNNVKYYLFTDNKYFKSKSWNVLNTKDLNIDHLDPRKKARFIKVNSHKVLPEHDISIWLDHCFSFKINDIENMLNSLSFHNKNIMCYAHDERKCIYDEANICKIKKLDNHKLINNQIDKYKVESFPKNFGLFSTGLIIRKKNKEVNSFNELWWDEIYNHSGRDQLSQSYASWKTSVRIDPINIGKNIYNNNFLTIKSQHIKIYKY
jgi:hypothetical protein